MTLDCVFQTPEDICDEDAVAVIGGFSLCEEHKGEWGQVAAFYEQLREDSLLDRARAAHSANEPREGETGQP